MGQYSHLQGQCDPGRPRSVRRRLMTIGQVCTREVIIAYPETTIAEAARLMREYHVGNVVIVAGPEGKRAPLGIVTDRDLVVEVLAKQASIAGLTVGEITIQDLVSAREDEGVFEVIELMRFRGIRRLPIVDGQGSLVGIVSLDDLLEILAEELETLVKLVSRERAVEQKVRK